MACVRAVTLCCSALFLIANFATARPTQQRHQLTEPNVDVDIIGDVDGTQPTLQKVLQDTIWIATWTHDVGSVCDFTNWEKVDNRILNDGSLYWDLTNSFAGTGNIAGWAAAVGYEDNICCEGGSSGYDNSWYQGIRIEYDDTAAARLTFDYEVDSEGGFDFLQVEADSGCASFDRVDFDTAPDTPASAYRRRLHSDSGLVSGGSVTDLTLPSHGGGTSCVYIGFSSDGAWSPCDGLHPTNIGKAVVVDNIVLDENGVLTSEDFEDEILSHGWTFVNMQDTTPFGPVSEGGSWARIYRHISDNDLCTENTTCAILWTDFTTPTIASDPAMAFGPGGYVIKRWLDDIIVSPWVDLSGTPGAQKTILQFRRFPGNFFSIGQIVQNWSVRGITDVDDGMGGTIECTSEWGHSHQWNSLSIFAWVRPTASGNPPGSGYDMSSHFPLDSKRIQVRHRTSDWAYIAGGHQWPWAAGPGPYIDDTRVGRVALTGPAIDEGIDARSQGQDSYATEIDPTISPGTGEHHRPTTNRFGVTAFNSGGELTINAYGPNLVTGDSIFVEVQDVRGHAVTAISLFGSIVDGPHAGKAPPPHFAAGGIFQVPASQALAGNSLPQANCGIGCVPDPGVVFIDNFFYVDLDDEYFVGGDVLQYFWLAEDDGAGFTSDPVGLNGVPGSWAEAQAATNGLFEVNFLPVIDWDPDYLAAVAASNKVDPNADPAYLDGSWQRNCILYVNRVNARRRSGHLNRTSFMYTLDRLQYRGYYDVYDHSGMGNTNNHLASRASVAQAQGYNLIIYDAGNAGPSGTIMPAGDDLDSQKVDQAGWFVSWLAQASVSEAGFATLWVLASNALEERPTNPLYANAMGTTFVAPDQDLNFNPDVVGQTAFTFDAGISSNSIDFTVGARAVYSLNGGCPVVRHYDAQDAGLGTNVYLFADPSSSITGDAAVVMNSNPAANWNTILMSHPWFDIREDRGQPPGSLTNSEDILHNILGAALPVACNPMPPVDAGEGSELTAPRRTRLYGNAPNPFNPMTTIRFDLAHRAHTTLRIYDVSGRLVRTLVNQQLDSEHHGIIWDGSDDAGRRVASGVYVYRLTAGDFTATQRMVVLR